MLRFITTIIAAHGTTSSMLAPVELPFSGEAVAINASTITKFEMIVESQVVESVGSGEVLSFDYKPAFNSTVTIQMTFDWNSKGNLYCGGCSRQLLLRVDRSHVNYSCHSESGAVDKTGLTLSVDYTQDNISRRILLDHSLDFTCDAKFNQTFRYIIGFIAGDPLLTTSTTSFAVTSTTEIIRVYAVPEYPSKKVEIPIEIPVEPQSAGCYFSILIPAIAISAFAIFIVIFILRSVSNPGEEEDATKLTQIENTAKTLALLHVISAFFPPIIQTAVKSTVFAGYLMIIFGFMQIIFHFIKHYVTSKSGDIRSKSGMLFFVVGSGIFNIAQGTAMIAGVDFGESGMSLIIAASWFSFLGPDVLSNVLEVVLSGHERYGLGVTIIYFIGFGQRVSNIYLYGKSVSISDPEAFLCDLSTELSAIMLVIECLYCVGGVIVFIVLYSRKDTKDTNHSETGRTPQVV